MQSTQSFLVVASDKNNANSYISLLLKEFNVDSFDTNRQYFEKTMGIEDVRNIQKTILLTPFRGKIKAVVLDLHNDITIEAQNALLKLLEEPPINTIIIVSVSKKEVVLPTIISRCKLIFLHEKANELFENEIIKYKEELDTILNDKIGDKMKIAEIVAKDKENIFLWFKKITIFVKNKMEKENNPKYLKFLKQLQKTHRIIKSSNVGQRTALENLFLAS